MKPQLHMLGMEIRTYNLFFGIALGSVPVFLFALRKRFGFTIRQAGFYSGFTLVFGLLSALMTGLLKQVMLKWASGGAYSDDELLRNYGIPVFLPLFLLAYCRIFRDDFKKLSDYIAPCVYSVMTFIKVGCTFNGCCYGHPYAAGIWNEDLGYRTFPVQVLDAFTSLLIVLTCLLLIRLIREKHPGYIYPIGGVLFALTKGFWEFFRVHTSKYERSFFNTGLTMWQYWMLVLLAGCIIWIAINRKQKVKE